MARAAVHADLIINLPVLKGHSVTLMTGAVKNLFGVLSKPSRRRVHAVGLHRAIHALAPTCAHCKCRIIGHGVESKGKMFCCEHCAHA